MIQDIKRLFFFQKVKTLVTILLLALSLYFVTPLNTGCQFDFLASSHVGKKISHIKQMKDNAFVMGRASNGLSIVGLKSSSVFLAPILQNIQSYDFVIAGSRQFKGVKQVRLLDQNVQAFFLANPYGKKVVAFTSFERAQQLLKKKDYFVAQKKTFCSLQIVQMIAFLFLVIFSGYFVFLKLGVVNALLQFGVDKVNFWLLYLVLAALVSFSLDPFLFCYKYCLMSVLFFAWHAIFNSTNLLKNLRGVVFE